MKLIANKGVQGFTIKNLSKEIGISEPAIYRHFESKTDILIAILNNFKKIGEMMTLIIENSDSAIAKIEFMFSKIFEIFAHHPSIISVLFAEEIFKNNIVLRKKIAEIQNLHHSNIENIISKGQADGDVRTDIDKNSFALMFLGSLRLLIKRWDLNNKINLKTESENLINSFKLIIQK